MEYQQNFLPPKKKDYKNKAMGLGRFFLIVFRVLPYFVLVVLTGVIFLAVFAGISLAPYSSSISSVYQEGREAKINLERAAGFIQKKDFNSALNYLQKAQDNFQVAEKGLKNMEEAAVFNNAYAEDQLTVAKEIVFIGNRLSDSLTDLTSIAQEINNILTREESNWEQISDEKKEKILGILYNSSEDFKQVQIDFVEVGQHLQEVERHRPLFVFDRVIDPLHRYIPQLKRAFDSVIVMSKLLPAFAGYPEEKTYLFIMENNREMRPAGGFIGTYGLVKIKNAQLREFFTDNSYNLDKKAEPYLDIEPPEPIAKYMDQPKWFFRDSNWWPDWPTSAEQIKWFYQKEGGKNGIDGVIAITPDVISDILGLMGSFEVSGLTFSQDNFWEQLEYHVEYGYVEHGTSVEERKSIIGDLGKKMIDRLYELPMSKWPGLIDIVSNNVLEKHILLYFEDSEMQALAEENNWAGRVKNFNGDYLMLVDANLAALKTDEVMERTMNYNLSEKDQGFVSTVRVNYQNMGNFSWKTTRYRTYTRLYVPLNSELLSIKVGEEKVKDQDIDLYREFDKTAFGLFFQVEPQQSVTVEWKYRLPESLSKSILEEYNLMVQKQPGIPKMNLQLDLNFQKSILGGPEFSKDSGKNQVKHVEVLKKDQQFSVWLK